MELEYKYCSCAQTLLSPFWFYISRTIFFLHVNLDNYMCTIIMDFFWNTVSWKFSQWGWQLHLVPNPDSLLKCLHNIFFIVTSSLQNGVSLSIEKKDNGKSNQIMEYYWLTCIQMSIWWKPRNTNLRYNIFQKYSINSSHCEQPAN